MVVKQLAYKGPLISWTVTEDGKCLEYIIPELNSVCCAMGTVTPLMQVESRKLVPFHYVNRNYPVVKFGGHQGDI
jgi:hypothetical protein